MENLETKHGPIKFATKPYDHQAEGLRRANGARYFAYFCEQGTGKSWIIIQEIAQFFLNEEIDTVLVLAPKGVDLNWLKTQLPVHMPIGDSLWHAALWRPAQTKKQQRIISELMEFKGLRILAMNWEALNTKRAFNVAQNLLEKSKGALIVGDESQKFKNPKARRTKALMKIRGYSTHRRIASGTAAPNSPFDLYTQMNFLHPSILDEASFYSFKARYGVLAEEGNPLYNAVARKIARSLVGGIAKKIKAENPNLDDRKVMEQAEQESLKKAAKRMPQLVLKDGADQPMYRNLDELYNKISEHSYRVLKKDCLDLPPKVYTQTFFELTPKQQKIYDELHHKNRLMLDDDTIQPMIKLAALTKMSQVGSGFFVDQTKTVHRIEGPNPKLELMKSRLEDLEGKAIIWANLRAELADVASLCKELEIPFVEYHGGVNDALREEAMDRFQDGDARVFIGQQKAGGTGLTLTAANRVFYYSNSFALEDRLQSEDRAHRIGQTETVVYEDLTAADTIDERMIRALQHKENIASIVMGDEV